MSDEVDKKFCIGCLEDVPVTRIEQLGKGGRHIKLVRCPTPVGHLYCHHAIVTDVNIQTEEITYFEISADISEIKPQMDLGAYVRKRCTKFSKMKKVLQVVYRTPFFTEEEIIQRANDIFMEKSWTDYRPLSNNCEHLVMYVMTDIRICFEQEILKDKFSHLLSYCCIPESMKDVRALLKENETFSRAYDKLMNCVQKLENMFKTSFENLPRDSADDIQHALVTGMEQLFKMINGSKKLFELAKTVLNKLKDTLSSRVVQVGVFLYLCYDILNQTNEAIRMNDNDVLCTECFISRILNLISRALMGIVSLILLYAPGLCGAIYGLGILAYDVILAPLSNAIGELIFPSYSIPKWRISSWDDLHIGDVATISYWYLPHEVLVSGIFPRRVLLKVSTFRADGFSDQAWMNFEEVSMCLMSSQWKETTIEKYDYSGIVTYSAEEVVNRTNRGLETQLNGTYKYNTLELINKVKVVNTDDVERTPPKIRTPVLQLLSGDVIEIETSGRKRTAILIDIQFIQEKSDSRCIQMIHYAWADIFATRTITEEMVEMDMKMIQRHDYSGHVTYSAEETIQKARQRKGEQRFNTFWNRSSHFIKDCKEREDTSCEVESRHQPEQVLDMLFSDDESSTNLLDEEIKTLQRQTRFVLA